MDTPLIKDLDDLLLTNQLKHSIEQLTSQLLIERETYTDDLGSVWTRPTAFAYCQVCKALTKAKKEKENLEEMIMGNTVRVNLVLNNKLARIPVSAHGQEDAGSDLYSIESGLIRPGELVTFDIGISIELPTFVQAEIRSRSGLAKKLIVVANQPGTIDPSYRGQVRVMLANLGREAYQVEAGDKIAQMVLVPYLHADFRLVDQLSDTVRGSGGFGSSGR